MKSFLQHIKEEVLPTVQVADGGLDIDKPAVRAAINAAIAGVVSQPAVTPYVVFNRLSKLLAQYHIVLPKRFLEGDKGVEVFEIRQFGHRMGMTDSGEFINQVPTTHYLFMQYGIITPMGVTYAKPLVGGMFRVTARLVDKVELDRLLDMAEITIAEEAECMQAIAKANAPKDEMHDITSDEKKKGNKAAVADSEKGLAEEERPNAWGQYPKEAKQIRKQLRQEKKAKAFAKAQAKSVKEDLEEGQVTGSRSYKGSPDRKRKAVQMALGRKHKDHPDWNERTNPQHSALTLGRKLQKQGVSEDKDPCWKGYEMIGMKKKGGRKVPNCVPANEEALDEVSLAKAAKTARQRNIGAERDAHASPYDYSPHIDVLKTKAYKTLDRIEKKHGEGTAKKIAGKMNKDTNDVWRGKFDEGRMPASVIAHKQKLSSMSDEEFSKKYGNKSEKDLRDMAARHGYGWNKEAKTGSDHYVKRLSALQKEETLDEKLTKKMSAGQVIHDFVHSDNPKFKGKSVKQRQKMALGAYYGMHPEKSKGE